MTYEEALEAARKGKRIKHRHFTENEYFEIANGQLVCEQGCPMDAWYLGDDWQKTGWSIIE